MYGVQDKYISNRVNVITSLDHQQLLTQLPQKIKTQSFFSARVSEARILERLRNISDMYSRGELSLGEARTKLKQFLQGSGYNPHEAGLKNLASTARLNLILQQNSSMAKAVGDYHRMHKEENMKVFPYVRYHARNDSRSRSSHADLDGKIFRKDDPFLRTHTPPWEFNCRCYLEEITEKEANKTPALIQKETPMDQVRVESSSGFAFDPAHAFEEFDLKTLNLQSRGAIREQAEMFYGDRLNFKENNTKVILTEKNYTDFDKENLPSAKTWQPVNAPTKIIPDNARKMLEQGIAVALPDNEYAILDKTVLIHWEQECCKSQSDVLSRLAVLDYAIKTLQNPVECWFQESQKRYLKVFKNSKGKLVGCMVCVTNNGKCRTYFVPSINQINKMRSGIKYKVF